MTNFEQYVGHCPAGNEGDEQKLARECRILLEAVPAGVAEHVGKTFENPTSLAKFTSSAVAGFIMSRAWSGGGICGVVARGAGSAMGVMTVGELMHTDRLLALDGALGHVWNNDANLTAQRRVLADTLGSFLVDGSIATAGGLLGSALGTAGMGRTAAREWPAVVSGKIHHPFGEGVTYGSTARGAALRLPTGEHYIWSESRPVFETNYQTGVTTFGDGSKLTISPGRKVEFRASGLGAKDGRLVYEADLRNDTHFWDFRRGRQWERVYALGAGTLVEQNPRGYLVTHTSGNSDSLLSKHVSNPGQRGKLTFELDGSRHLALGENTSVRIAPDGSVDVVGTKKTELWTAKRKGAPIA